MDNLFKIIGSCSACIHKEVCMHKTPRDAFHMDLELKLKDMGFVEQKMFKVTTECDAFDNGVRESLYR